MGDTSSRNRNWIFKSRIFRESSIFDIFFSFKREIYLTRSCLREDSIWDVYSGLSVDEPDTRAEKMPRSKEIELNEIIQELKEIFWFEGENRILFYEWAKILQIQFDLLLVLIVEKLFSQLWSSQVDYWHVYIDTCLERACHFARFATKGIKHSIPMRDFEIMSLCLIVQQCENCHQCSKCNYVFIHSFS